MVGKDKAIDNLNRNIDFIKKSNGLANVATTEGFNSLSNDARGVLDSAYRAVTEQTKNNNTYGGKTITYTDAAGNKIEMYYDNYLSLKHYDLRLDHHKNKELFKGKINKKISKLLNETYIKTYNCKHISFYYKFNIWLYKKIKYLYLLVPFNILKKIVGINSFLDRNKGINLINEDNKIEFRGYDKKMSKKDLNYLYDLSIKRSIEYIKQVNDYLYK